MFLTRETHSTTTQETHIPSEMCFPYPGTYIPSDMCTRNCYWVGKTHSTTETHIRSGMCFPGRGTHITGDMCFPGRGTHITSDMCIPGRGTHIITNYTPINLIVHFSLKEVKPSLPIAKLIKLLKCDNLFTSLQHFHKKL